MGKRLIGFKAISSLNLNGRRTIRTICPITDKPDCSESLLYTENSLDIVAYIPGEPVQQTLITDSLSKQYGNQDGYSFCSFDLEYAPASLPLWMDINDGLVTIGANTELDPADEITVTVTVSRDSSLATERTPWGTFTARLVREGELSSAQDGIVLLPNDFGEGDFG